MFQAAKNGHKKLQHLRLRAVYDRLLVQVDRLDLLHQSDPPGKACLEPAEGSSQATNMAWCVSSSLMAILLFGYRHKLNRAGFSCKSAAFCDLERYGFCLHKTYANFSL